jgi:soluble lytic murein transglycosylase
MKETKIIAILGIISIMLVACDGINLPFLTPSTPTPTITPMPTATPSPMPTPTATPTPVEALSEGERYLRNGQWDEAVIALRAVALDPAADLDERAEAQYHLGEAFLRSGDFSNALWAFDTLLANYPDHPLAANAYFLRGDAKMGIGDWQGAIDDFNAYLARRPGLIDSYVYERIGDSYLAMGYTDEAMTAYQQAISAGRYLVGWLQLVEKVSQLDRSLGDPSGAVAQYEAILSVAESSNYRASIEFMMAQAMMEAGRYDDAYEQFEHIFLFYPETYEAYSALVALLDADREVDSYQRGVVNFNQGQYEVALDAFYAYLAEAEREHPADAQLYIAYCYRALGNIDAARTELETVIETHEEDARWGDAWLELADIQADSGDTEGAITTYTTFAETYPALSQAPDALYRAMELAQASGDAARAATLYRQLATSYPADETGMEGFVQLGVNAYLVGDWNSAETLLTEAMQQTSGEAQARAALWLGKLYLLRGSTEQATAALNTAVAANPGGFYALRAEDLLAGRDPFASGVTLTIPQDPDEGRAEAEEWLVSVFGLSATPPLAASLREDLASDLRMVRGNELWLLGARVEAKQDFESLRTDYASDPLASYQLAIYFRDIGLYRSSILATANLLRLAGVDTLEAPEFLARLRYPVYYSDLIVPLSRQYGLDPLLVFALVRQESLYEGFATSSAAAQGLMQIWPPTGEDIADAMGWPNYSPADLQRPYINVQFGTFLLNDELERFDGDPFAVLAAYNAGTGNAMTWQAQSGGDPDLFVEVINMHEPQIYVQYIYEHYAVYRALYGTAEP